MKEQIIERMFVKKVKQMGGMALKVNSTTMAGLPDRMVLLPHGVLFFAELKATGKKPRVLQEFVHKKLKDLGFTIYVIDSKEQVEEVLKGYELCTAYLSKTSH